MTFWAAAEAAGIILGVMLLAWGAYAFGRIVFRGDLETGRTFDLAGPIMLRTASLHGLILALVFAQELVSYQRISTAVTEEATAVADIFYDIGRYDEDEAPPVRAALVNYLRLVIDEEWRTLSEEGELWGPAWGEREKVYLAVLDLEPATPRQTTLRGHMLEDVQLIAELRERREAAARSHLSLLFLVPAVLGVALVAATCFVYAPTAINLGLMGIYGGFSGVVIFIIYALSDPFDTPGDLSTDVFARMLERLAGAG